MVRSIDWKCYLDDEKRIFAIGRDITSHKQTQKELVEQSHLDQITGIPGRQSFLTLLQNELSGSIRYHYPTAVIMIDIDHFRNFNEKYGIQKGDECLRSIGSALKTLLRRKTDFLARFENDCFVVLLSHTDLEKAIKSAEYLRESLEKMEMRNDPDPSHQRMTISLGVSAIPEKIEKEVTTEFMVSSVRRALSVSQQRGGNQVNYSKDFETQRD
jgi:diguanylate cyclase (GGDEF)-like protein